VQSYLFCEKYYFWCFVKKQLQKTHNFWHFLKILLDLFTMSEMKSYIEPEKLSTAKQVTFFDQLILSYNPSIFSKLKLKYQIFIWSESSTDVTILTKEN
jgi:hypothetical protein